jgi:hypothetical protein
VYWTNQGEPTRNLANLHSPRRGAVLMRAPRVGGSAELMERCLGLCWNASATRDAVFTLDYASGDIVRVDKTTGRLTRVASRQTGANALLADGDKVYWSADGRILRSIEGGGEPTLVATARQVNDLAADDQFLYWLDEDGAERAGTLRRIRK